MPLPVCLKTKDPYVNQRSMTITKSDHRNRTMRKPVFGFPTRSNTNCAATEDEYPHETLDLGRRGIVLAM